MTVRIERRNRARSRALKGGKIFFNNYCISYDCIIRNENEAGMLLKVGQDALVPREFFILNRKDGTLAEARMVWHRGTQIGIELLTTMEDVRQSSKPEVRQMSHYF